MNTEQSTKPSEFFARHPIFRFEEFRSVHSGDGQRSPQTTASVLRQHVAAGNLINIRRGLYATVPRGLSVEEFRVDPYLLAAHLTEDSVLAYHAALQFHGKAYSIWNRFHYLTRSRLRRFQFGDAEFVPVQAPTSVRGSADLGGNIVERSHAGRLIRVTSLERTLVDVLDAPKHGGDWEEIWRSLESIEFFDIDRVIDYASRLGSALTAARVGYFLEQRREELMIEEEHLDALRALAPRQPRYFDSQRDSGDFVSNWNLIVSDAIRSRAWEEQNEC